MLSKLHIKDKSETGKLIKIAVFRKEIKKTEPHKHNSYFEIIFLSKGSGTHAIDYNTYKVEPPSAVEKVCVGTTHKQPAFKTLFNTYGT